ncbi:hypothetical protein [Streptomyces sp. NPDC052036]|uniref:hypothetical protein n=1 Tax=Streptomyces sp. NPDC052036 TaxID=3155171 RepID=UPI0034394967
MTDSGQRQGAPLRQRRLGQPLLSERDLQQAAELAARGLRVRDPLLARVVLRLQESSPDVMVLPLNFVRSFSL